MYKYEEIKPCLFTDEGQRKFLKIRDHVHATLAKSGAITMGKALIAGGDTWEQLACVDRMVELGEIREVVQRCDDVPDQYRVFVPARQ